MTDSTKKPFLSAIEMAKILGVSRASMYKYSDEDPNFPHYRQGKTRRFDADEVLDYMGRNNRTNKTS